MSHEIRTPINSILSYSSLLQEDVKDKIDESLKDGFSIIQNSGHRLIKTIDSILNLSQFQTGSFDLNKKNTNLCNILKDLFEEFKRMAEQKNIKLILDVGKSECFAYVDQYTISQLIANLVDNAIKYTEKGKVEITLRNIDNKIAIEVSDTGIGMSDEFKEKLFSPFTQEEQGYTRRYEGSGLGLSLVNKYAEVNNAEIKYSSIKGKGTKFTLLLNR
jgi:signal transduction histidine kinase